ncbi:MAG: nicotinamide-nucleotide amidohydrolase family protein [Eubacteriales bacterium]|nr:nicotinamide-nucleotide amidohydrolase family protein [Eubacteriales bacterium]
MNHKEFFLLDEVHDIYGQITKILIEKKMQITTMESATSGQIASLITDTEGSSAIMKGAFVTYSNEAKIMQGVSAKTIENYGVYSLETAVEMAQAAKRAYGADFAIGVTGTMGNVDPANTDSIPGQVYFAIVTTDKTFPYYIELEAKETRLDYKLCVALEVGKELLQIISQDH